MLRFHSVKWFCKSHSDLIRMVWFLNVSYEISPFLLLEYFKFLVLISG